MRQRMWVILLLVGILAVMPLRAQDVTPEPTPETTAGATADAAAASDVTTYVVQPGDTLYRIALRFNTTVSRIAELNGISNPARILAGQRLRIPASSAATPTPTPAPATPPATATPTTTPAAAATTTPAAGVTGTHVVQRGETLVRIALRYNTTVAELVRLNNIGNPSLIYVGQRLVVPAAGTAGTSAPAAATSGMGYGIVVYTAGQDPADLISSVATLGLRWVKLNVYWRDVEPVQGEQDFAALDTAVQAFADAGVSVLLTVTTSPDWASTATCRTESRPPDNLADYAAFVGTLAGRYAGKVQAYEIWSEPNLRREWSSADCRAINSLNYIDLLRGAYAAVKQADPRALVVSAGLAPTGFNDFINGINDRVFLRALYDSGLAQVSDAIGAHPIGFANPPDATCCTAAQGVLTHYEDRSFYFLDTLRDYRDMMVRARDGQTQLWVTDFGWGSSDDTTPPVSNSVFFTYTSLEEQATYNARAFVLGGELGYVGAMFLNNLNACTTVPQDRPRNVELCYYSLTAPNGSPRPAFAAVQALGK